MLFTGKKYNKMDRLKANITFFQSFTGLSPKQRNMLIKFITRDQALALCDVAANILSGGLHISQSDKDRLTKHKSFIRCIGTSSTRPADRVQCARKHPKAAILLILATINKLTALAKLR
jgi:hypothetical protein